MLEVNGTLVDGKKRLAKDLSNGWQRNQMSAQRTFGNQSAVTAAEPTPTSPLDLKPTEDGLLSLTALHKLAVERGLAGGKMDPGKWSRKPDGRKWKEGGPGYTYIESATKKLNVLPQHIYRSTRGKHGGTYAHPLIALKQSGKSRLAQLCLLEVSPRNNARGHLLTAKATHLGMFRSDFGRGWER